jgi:pimeloyl-ACP methyl ester carboxylesterase
VTTSASTSESNFLGAQQRALQRYGVESESRFVDVEVLDGTAHVLVAGEGPPVLLVPGGGLPAAMWAPLMAELTGFSLYAVDLPGLGLTKPTAYSSETVRAFSGRFLDQLATGLDLDRPVLVGSSVGGQWSTWLALDQPDRLAALVLIGCPAGLLGTSAPLPLRLMTLPGMSRLANRLQPPSSKQVDQFAKMAGEDFSEQCELRDLLVAAERLPTWNASLTSLVRTVVTVRGARPRATITAEELSGLRAHVQIVWGDRDPFGGPEVGRRAAELIPDAELHVVPGGHGPWFGGAERIIDLIRPALRRATSTSRSTQDQTRRIADR